MFTRRAATTPAPAPSVGDDAGGLLRAGLAAVVGATTSIAGKTSLLPDAVWAWAQSIPGTTHSDSVPINRNRVPILFHPHSIPAALVPAGWLRMILGMSVELRIIQNVPDTTGKIPGSLTGIAWH